MTGGFHTSVQKNRARKESDGFGHVSVTGLGLIPTPNRPRMNTDKPNVALRDDAKDRLEKTVVLETNSHFHGQTRRSFLSQNIQYLPYLFRFTKKSPANVFSINSWSGTAQI
jgi:hypothetical protein